MLRTDDRAGRGSMTGKYSARRNTCLTWRDLDRVKQKGLGSKSGDMEAGPREASGPMCRRTVVLSLSSPPSWETLSLTLHVPRGSHLRRAH